jgi:hypothetical protein
MKKVCSLLIVLASLAFLDGTPLHYHRSKFILVKTRSSIQEVSAFISLSDQVGEASDSNEDESHGAVTIRPTLSFDSKLNFLAHQSPVTLPKKGGRVPLYTLDCYFRI